jgi:GrxC family glutaredoxin
MDAETAAAPSIATHLHSGLKAFRGAWRNAARVALDIALPTLCVACREPVDGEGVCSDCWAKLSFIAPPFCPRLGIPFVYDPGPDMLSMEAIANPPAYARARAAVRYDDVARTLVHALKYQDRTDLAPTLGRWMARAGQDLLDGADMLIPVPLHWRRAWHRRYNQSGALARIIERHSGVGVVSEVLRRIRPTEQQIGLSRPQRASNVQGAFRPTGADRRPSRRADRRRPHLGRDRGCMRARTLARQGGVGGRAGICPGCGWPLNSHIIGNHIQTEGAMTAAIEIYTRPGCGYCTAAKSLLTRKNAAFTELSVAADPLLRQRMYDRAGAGSTFPQIFIGETHVGGCEELYALDRTGKLDALLGGEKATS